MENEKYAFVREHEKEIRPITDDQETLNAIDQGALVSPEALQLVLERYETKIFSYGRKDARPDAKRLLLEAAQPANFNIVNPLLESLEHDERCSGVTLLTDNVSGKKFMEKHDPDLQTVPTSERPIIGDIPEGPYRAVLVLDEAENTPASVLLYGAKSVFGAEKLCYLSLGLFGHVEKRIFGPERSTEMEDIDIIFSADEFSKQMLCGALGVPEEKVVVTGTPLLEGLRVEEANMLREKGRAALGVAEGTLTLAYAGFPSIDFQSVGGDPKLNPLTFEQTLTGVMRAAEAEPEKNFALVVRTHPRARNVEPSLIPTQTLPENLAVVDGNGITYEEFVYAADIIGCNVLSTESLLARYRGREAAIFAFSGKGQLGELLTENFGEKGEQIIKASDRMTLIDSPEKLSEMIARYQPREAIPVHPGSLERIKEIMLAPIKSPSQAV